MMWYLPFVLSDINLNSANPARLSDAYARSSGNDIPSARAIAFRAFAKIEQVQVLKVRVDHVGDHRVAGMRLSGVKFHGTVKMANFVAEIKRLAYDALASAPIDEIDIEVTVPPSAQRGIAVTGESGPVVDSTIFTVTVQRGESQASFDKRIAHNQGVFWDPSFYRDLTAKK